MTHADASALGGAVDTILAELEKESGWIAELSDTLAAARTRRTALAQALDASLATLEPEARKPYEERVAKMLCPTLPNRRPGRYDPRRQAALSFVATWPRLTITTTDLRLHLVRHGFEFSRVFPHKFMKSLEEQGVVMKVAHATYRLSKLHPKLVHHRLEAKQTVEPALHPAAAWARAGD